MNLPYRFTLEREWLAALSCDLGAHFIRTCDNVLRTNTWMTTPRERNNPI